MEWSWEQNLLQPATMGVVWVILLLVSSIFFGTLGVQKNAWKESQIGGVVLEDGLCNLYVVRATNLGNTFVLCRANAETQPFGVLGFKTSVGNGVTGMPLLDFGSTKFCSAPGNGSQWYFAFCTNKIQECRSPMGNWETSSLPTSRHHGLGLGTGITQVRNYFWEQK